MKINLFFIYGFTFFLMFNQVLVSQEVNISNEKELDTLLASGFSKIHSDWLGALEDYLLAEQIAIRNDKGKELSLIYKRLSFLYRFKSNNLTESLVYQRKGYENALKYSDTINMIRFLNNIGAFYISFEAFQKAEDYLKKADSLNKIVKDLAEQRFIDLSFIELYCESKQYDKMLIYFDKANEALKNGVTPSDGFIKMANYVNTGIGHLNMGNYDKSIEYAKIAAQSIRNHGHKVKGDEDLITFSWALLSRSYYQLGDWNKSIIYADSALRKVKKYYNDSDLDGHFYYSYSNSLFNLGRKEEALKVLQDFAFLTDTIVREKLINEGKNIEATNLIKNRMNSLEVDKNLALLNLEKTKKRNLLLLFAACSSILILLVFRYKLKKNKLAKQLLEVKQKESRKTIDQKNREVAAKMLRLSNTQNTLSDISNELKEAEKTIVITPDLRRLLNSIYSKISTSNSNMFWNEFEKRFEEIHPDFYSKLHNKHNNLSRGEQLLCAYLKLHLNTKEIAQISGITIRSVEVYRTRLRKKLGISNKDVNLNSYIQQL